jgi:hypothetical protein
MGSLEQKFRRVGNASAVEMIRRAEAIVNGEKYMEDIILKRFARERERAVGGKRWAKLAKSTLKQKRSPWILFETGVLKLAAYGQVMGTFRMSRMKKWVVPGIEYAGYIQDGTGKMPARPYMLTPNALELRPAVRRARKVLGDDLRRKKL